MYVHITSKSFVSFAVIHACESQVTSRVLLNTDTAYVGNNLCNIRWNGADRSTDIKWKARRYEIRKLTNITSLFRYIRDKTRDDNTVFTWLTKKRSSWSNSFRDTYAGRRPYYFPPGRFSSVPARTRFHIRRSTLRAVTCLLKLDMCMCVCGTDSYHTRTHTCMRIERARACAR